MAVEGEVEEGPLLLVVEWAELELEEGMSEGMSEGMAWEQVEVALVVVAMVEMVYLRGIFE